MSYVTYEWVYVTYEGVMSRMNESCHVWMSHVNMIELCHVWMSYVTYEWVMSHMDESMSHKNESCHTWMRHVTYDTLQAQREIGRLPDRLQQVLVELQSHVTYEWVMSHMNETCHIWGPTGTTRDREAARWSWRRGVVSHMNESCHIWMGHVPYKSRQDNTRSCGRLSGARGGAESFHIWMSYVTYEWVVSHMNESCHV